MPGMSPYQRLHDFHHSPKVSNYFCQYLSLLAFINILMTTAKYQSIPIMSLSLLASA